MAFYGPLSSLGHPGMRLTTYRVEHVDDAMHHQIVSNNPTANFETEEHLLSQFSGSALPLI